MWAGHAPTVYRLGAVVGGIPDPGNDIRDDEKQAHGDDESPDSDTKKL